MKHLLKVSDLTKEEILDLIETAVKLKRLKQEGTSHKYLPDKSLGMIFQKPSTRTRLGFELGIFELGGKAVFFDNQSIQLGRGESVQDTVRVFSRFVDAIVIRTFAQATVEKMAIYSSVPIINALTEYSHPCQILSDFMTVSELKGNDFENLKLCYVGPGNSIANSLIVGCTLLGMRFSIACQQDYLPSKSVIAFAQQNQGKLLVTNDIRAAANGSDIIYTAPFGQQKDVDEEVLSKFQINEDVLSYCKPDVKVLHCLPAFKGKEITEDVFEKHADEIFLQAENRLHMEKAVLIKLLGGNNAI